MISIVIASYNQAEYLPEAIESALNQTLKPWQIIIVDDGSTDESLEIARKYEKDRPDKIKVISQVNKGLASARNTGLMNVYVNCTWVLFLDADDILEEDAIKLISVTQIENPDADIIAPSFKTFGTSNEQVILMDNPKLEDFFTGNRIGYFSAIRKSKLLEIGGYSPKMTWGYEDLHLWFNLLTRGCKIVTLKDVLVLYRTKDKSMWHDAMEHHEELMSQINKDFKLW